MPKEAVSIASVEREIGEATGEIHLFPAGVFRARDGRGPWRLDKPDEVIAATRQLNMQLPVDYEHQTDLAPTNGQAAPAAGWIVGLRAAPDGLWGKVEWTAKARAMIAAREYRFISPVFNYKKTGRITRLLRAALTNNPALELTALARAETGENMNEFLMRLAAALGMPETATEDELVETVASLVADKKDAARYVPLGDVEKMVKEFNASQAETSEAQAVATVDAAMKSGRLRPALREWGLTLCRSDPAAFDTFIKNTSPVVAPGETITGKPVARHSAAVDDTAVSLCRQLGIEPEALGKTMAAL